MDVGGGPGGLNSIMQGLKMEDSLMLGLIFFIREGDALRQKPKL